MNARSPYQCYTTVAGSYRHGHLGGLFLIIIGPGQYGMEKGTSMGTDCKEGTEGNDSCLVMASWESLYVKNNC